MGSFQKNMNRDDLERHNRIQDMYSQAILHQRLCSAQIWQRLWVQVESSTWNQQGVPKTFRIE